MKRAVCIGLRILLGIVSVLFMVFGILGIRDHLWHLLALGIMLFIVSVFWNHFKGVYLWEMLRMTVVGVLLIFAIFDFGLFIAGISVAWFHGPVEKEMTMVILGTDVKGDQPGDLLRLRLDKAIEYAEQVPDMPIIVSGKGRGEHTEAAIMESYLVTHGVDPTRIIQEDRAQSTRENLLFSKEIAKNENLPEEFLIVTNGYHQLRAYIYAKEYGITTHALSAPTTWYMLFPLSERERFLIATEWLGLSPDLVNKYQEI